MPLEFEESDNRIGRSARDFAEAHGTSHGDLFRAGATE
jgi:hypothetical protein